MDLLPGETNVGNGIIMTSRNWASDVLSEIADITDCGSYPQHISAFDFGRAIGRALSNCDDEDAYKELTRGMMHYFSQRG